MKRLAPVSVFLLVTSFLFSSCGGSKSNSPENADYKWVKHINYDVDLDRNGITKDTLVDQLILEELFEKAFSGEFDIYYDFEREEPMNSDSLKKAFEVRFDTFVEYDAATLLPVDTAVYQVGIRMEDIRYIRFFEEWSYDEENFRLDKKVLGIAPGKGVYDDQGNFLGVERMFWVFFE